MNWLAPGSGDLLLALSCALEGNQREEVPVGAILRDPWGRCLASGANVSRGEHDPLGHAEVALLRRTATRVGNYRLGGAQVTVTTQPCPLCAAALTLSRVETVRFPGDSEPVEACGVELAHWCGACMRFFFENRRQS
ncbi:MAG: nucleoside deaminase [Magnetococcales bacterium]|nr:nucleoside deaminase [Magnetococcales bacterium]